jgi:hypothetical protein
MKAIKTQIQNYTRPGVILMATLVAIITSVVAVNATQAITTPNAAFISYSLAPGANSAAITPVTNKSVLVMGCCTVGAGVGQVSLLHIPSTYIVWVGLESYNNAVITQGVGNVAGAHIVFIDFAHTVDIQVASADTIRVHNASTVTKAGNVTLIW